MTRLVCALCAVALCYASASAAERSHLSQDPQVNQARELIHAGRHRAALEILRPLTDPARADITDIRFLIGLSAITVALTNDKNQRNALLSEAIAALRAILVNHPELTRVRLELARAFFLKGDDGLSRRHFDRVLAGDPPAAMAVNIRRFLHTLRARRRWSGYLSLSIEENDNINSGSDSEVIYLSELPFVVSEESRPRAQTGLTISTGFKYKIPLNERWNWRFGADATRSEYEDHEFDQTYLLLRSGPLWLASERSEVGLQAVGGRRWVGGKNHSEEAGLRFDARHRATAKLRVNAQASWKKIQYRQRSGLDATDTEYALGITHLFSPLLQGGLGIGFSRERLGHSIRERNTNASLDVILAKGWTLGARLEWSRRRHNRNVPSLTTRQVDRKRIARLLLLNRGFTFFGFSPQLVVARERQKSNFTLGNYRRTRVDLRFVKQF